MSRHRALIARPGSMSLILGWVTGRHPSGEGGKGMMAGETEGSGLAEAVVNRACFRKSGCQGSVWA